MIKILIAEDDPASCKILKTLFTKWEFFSILITYFNFKRMNQITT